MVTRTRLSSMLYVHCLSYVVMGLDNLFLLRLCENAVLWIITGSNEEKVMGG